MTKTLTTKEHKVHTKEHKGEISVNPRDLREKEKKVPADTADYRRSKSMKER